MKNIKKIILSLVLLYAGTAKAAQPQDQQLNWPTENQIIDQQRQQIEELQEKLRQMTIKMEKPESCHMGMMQSDNEKVQALERVVQLHRSKYSNQNAKNPAAVLNESQLHHYAQQLSQAALIRNHAIAKSQSAPAPK
ncbi:MAG: hypothetical protein P4L31_01170 [Candidatus Babeliales bacterium]|nr:hypothetical protein [Candidatus Babeliales bacterium]